LVAVAYTAHLGHTFPTELQGVFGASSQLLAVVEQRQDLAVLGTDIAAVELGPASLPEQYSPNSLGFYAVFGKFPEDLTSDGVAPWGSDGARMAKSGPKVAK
jgi:hypothetical protein